MAGWDVVYGYLLGYLPTLSGLSTETVYDGPPVGEGVPMTFAVVGTDGESNAGGYTNDYDAGPFVLEQGEVLCWLWTGSGDIELPALRSTVNGWVSTLSTALRTDKTLGGLLTEGSEVKVSRVEPIRQQQTKSGAVVDAVVAVGYITRL